MFRNKLHAAQDLHKTYLKTIADSKQTVKKNERTYKEEVAKRDAARAEIANCKLKVLIFVFLRNFMHEKFPFIVIHTCYQS